MVNSKDSVAPGSVHTFTVSEAWVHKRADIFIAHHFSGYSRSFLQKLFAQHLITSFDKSIKASHILKLHDVVIVTFPEPEVHKKTQPLPEAMAISVIAKHDDFFIIQKPAGLLVHRPQATCDQATLADWLVQQHDELAHVGIIDRPGIVHRLDKDTSGLMIIPRTNVAHATLTDMFKARKICKTYLALVVGHPPREGSVDFFIGRHPSVRHKMHAFTCLTKTKSSRQALTHYNVLAYYKDFSLVAVKPVTGRTHQIRVHFAAIGHPVLSDVVYGSSSKLIKRQALHAHQLEFELFGIPYSFICALPEDMQRVLDAAQPIDQ